MNIYMFKQAAESGFTLGKLQYVAILWLNSLCEVFQVKYPHLYIQGLITQGEYYT